MKNVLIIVSILIYSSAVFADSLYIEPFEIQSGDAKEVSINLSNSESVTALQFELHLPIGLELVYENDNWMSLKERASSDHSVIINYNGIDFAKVVCFSNTNSPFNGNEGSLLRMRVSASVEFVGGSIELNNIKLSNASGKDILLDNSDCFVVGFIPVASIDLKEYCELKVGESVALTATIYPENATDKTLTWSSDNEVVATVDQSGNVVAVGLGAATITATCGSASASCSVTVVATPVESVTISQPTAKLKVGESVSLTATVSPEDATDKTVVWSTDNEAVATVDQNGNVVAVALGTATITATSGSANASCSVNVVATLVENIILTPESWSGVEGDLFTISATVMPENATDKSLLWSTSDESVATVDQDGNVVVIKEGSCVIIAAAADGSGIMAECVITSTSGVEQILSISNSFDVYDMNGILIKNDCDRDSLKSLMPGIYMIRQGNQVRKVVIR